MGIDPGCEGRGLLLYALPFHLKNIPFNWRNKKPGCPFWGYPADDRRIPAIRTAGFGGWLSFLRGLTYYYNDCPLEDCGGLTATTILATAKLAIGNCYGLYLNIVWTFKNKDIYKVCSNTFNKYRFISVLRGMDCNGLGKTYFWIMFWRITNWKCMFMTNV